MEPFHRTRRQLLLAAAAALPGAAAAASVIAAGAVRAARFRIGVCTDRHPPYVFAEQGRARGIFVDLLDDVAQETGILPDYRFLPWKRAQQVAAMAEDMLIMPLARSPEREPRFRWIAPVLSFDTVLFGRGEAPLALDAARRLPVGLMAGTLFERDAREAGFTDIQLAPDEFSNARKLHHGRIRGWITTDLVAPGVYRQAGFDATELQRGLRIGTPRVLWIAASPRFPSSLADDLQEAIARRRARGALGAIVARYR